MFPANQVERKKTKTTHLQRPNMNWYCADQGQQTGPVTEEQFTELVRIGKIQSGQCAGLAAVTQFVQRMDAEIFSLTAHSIVPKRGPV